MSRAWPASHVERGGDRAVGPRALGGARPHRQDRRARPRGRAADITRRRGHRRPACRRARPCLPREVALAQAASGAATAASWSPARRHELSEIIDLTAAAGGRGDRRLARLSSGELFDAYRALPRRPQAGRSAELLHAGSAGATIAARARSPSAPLSGVPLAVKDLFCTEGVPSQSGSRILEGYRPPYTATVVARLHGRRCASCWQRPTRTSSRWAPRTRTRAFGPVRNPGITRACPAAPQAEAPPPSRQASRPGHSAPTRAARSASPRPCAGSSA